MLNSRAGISCHGYHRTYLVIKEAKGQTLLRAWSSLTVAQRQDAADSVASFCQELASKTLLKLQSATGCEVLEDFLSADKPSTHPSWKSYLLGPFSLEEIRAYLTESTSDTQWSLEAVSTTITPVSDQRILLCLTRAILTASSIGSLQGIFLAFTSAQSPASLLDLA